MNEPRAHRVAPAAEPEPSFPPLRRAALATLQVNLGYRCNQACAHCHVDAGPLRTEEMSAATVDLVLAYAAAMRPQTLDITGGAPELNPRFRDLVTRARALGLAVIDRCNLTILGEPGQETLAEFLAAARVRVVASLPCYGADNVDRQRGQGVFARSIDGLRRLNALGYGDPASGLEVDLVYNPVGPHLPPAQAPLEATYRDRLAADFGLRFNRLLTLANMPIARFRHALERDGAYRRYLDLLVAAHRPENLDAVMCRSLVSVDWQGRVHDCDFNQMLGLPLGGAATPVHLSELLGGNLTGTSIAVGSHCYGCTAGQGSSCGGALAGS
jgi:radical SAM/Cys-rich protein